LKLIDVGVMEYANGDKFDGEWVKDKRVNTGKSICDL